VTRDYSPTFFSGFTFFRASLETGFHTEPRRAAVAIRGSDTILIAKVDDVSRIWANVTAGQDFPNAYLPGVLVELLSQVGFLERTDRILRSPSDMNQLLRESLGPKISAIQVSPETITVSSDGTILVSEFLETSDGLVRLDGMTDRKGNGHVRSQIVASLK
jgi:hypothetical protein